MSPDDIRDKVDLHSADITALNFIRDTAAVVFRKHYRQGLRSRIMEVLRAEDVQKETTGCLVGGMRIFPRARPLKVLRIFTKRFDCLEEALGEARRYAVIEKFLGPDHIAASREFVVDYIRCGGRQIVLCGLQDYVEGEILDPWRLVYRRHLFELCRCLRAGRRDKAPPPQDVLVEKARRSAASLIGRLKRMVLEAGCIPDLSGIGNLILTPTGNIRLVDINNISKVCYDDSIPVDDKGYPVCDKSIEVMAVIERALLDRSIDRRDRIYGRFLEEDRMRRVKALEDAFYSERGHRETR